MEYEARLREMDEKHQHELQELENAYQQTIMGEVERYQVNLPRKDYFRQGRCSCNKKSSDPQQEVSSASLAWCQPSWPPTNHKFIARRRL